MSRIAFHQRVYARLLRWLAGRGTRLMLVSLGDENPHIEMPELPEGYTTRALDPEDLLPWASPEYGLSKSFLTQAQARGDRCVGNFFGDDLVGYGFVTRSYAPVTEQVAVEIDDSLLYRYKGWTHPEHRRKYLSHARGRLNQTLFDRSAGQKMVSYVEAQNFASRLNHKDVHPQHLGWCGIVKLFGREWSFNTNSTVKHGFRLVPREDYVR